MIKTVHALIKKSLDEVFCDVVSRIIKVEVLRVISGSRMVKGGNCYRDLDYSGYHNNRSL